MVYNINFSKDLVKNGGHAGLVSFLSSQMACERFRVLIELVHGIWPNAESLKFTFFTLKLSGEKKTFKAVHMFVKSIDLFG